MGSYKSNDDRLSFLLKTIGILIVCIILVSCSQSLGRSEANMIMIDDPYCYEADTKIIYLESKSGRHGTYMSYEPYYDKDGNKCKYNVETGEWIPIEGSNE